MHALPAQPSQRRRWRLAAVISACALGTITAVGYFEWWLPNARLYDIEWVRHASDAERLAVALQVLRMPPGNHHDACSYVGDYGSVEDVPALINALWWLPDTGPDGAMDCDKVCCLRALMKLSAHDAGLNYSDWDRWWSGQQRAGRD